MKPTAYRILIADDTPSVHEAYRSIFSAHNDSQTPFPGAEKFIPQLTAPKPIRTSYDITPVNQAEEAIAAAAAAQVTGHPFALAILDVRMPPGIDGVQAARRLRAIQPDLQIVICTAYADYSWSELIETFPDDDGVLLLKKPFDAIEVQQLASALCRKWQLTLENSALIHSLEARVIARTGQLARATTELELALHAAQAANRAKNDFLRCVSHEFNTPLNGVQGAAGILSLSPDPETRQLSEVILASGTRLNRLISRILLYLQLESPSTIQPKPFYPSDILARSMEPHRATATAKGLTLQSNFSAPPGLKISSRSDLLENALDNLIENAIKFTPSGTVNVSLHHDADLKQLIIEVSDTGEGITHPRLDELTALFSPGDDSLTRKHEGIGIGLALIARIARHLGGTITFRPGSGIGSVFTLTVPCSVID